jgi:hypothetical protein
MHHLPLLQLPLAVHKHLFSLLDGNSVAMMEVSIFFNR